uniref:Uncharacterized protein n=1 Tax=Globisporangium ultimum (strain ATCC 200006 / CBS 805.95 / DAOM BR144) TaxID=431595 RepID=K3WVH1_GLOUD
MVAEAEPSNSQGRPCLSNSRAGSLVEKKARPK